MNMTQLPPEASCSKRYFINKALNDGDETKKPDLQYWKPKILEYVEQIRNFVPPRTEYTDGDVYTGTPGIAYLFYRLAKSPMMETHRREFAAKGIEYILTAEMYIKSRQRRRPTDRLGLLIGDAGFHAVAALLYRETGGSPSITGRLNHLDRYNELSLLCDPGVYHVSLDNGANELFVGRCGYLLGALLLDTEFLKPTLPMERTSSILRVIWKEGTIYSKVRRCASPLMYAYNHTEYIGAAHGVCSVMFTFLCFPWFLRRHSDIEHDVKTTTDWILSLQTENGNFPATVEEIKVSRPDNDDELVHWCHGAPGVVYLMAKAYLYWKEEKYLQSCIKCGELIWEKGLLKKGPGICHGIAGNAYVFLLLYRLTKDTKYIHRATVFAEFTQSSEFRSDARTPDSPFSLFEGLAGSLCFLLDLFHPDQAAFPFMDAFCDCGSFW